MEFCDIIIYFLLFTFIVNFDIITKIVWVDAIHF